MVFLSIRSWRDERAVMTSQSLTNGYLATVGRAHGIPEMWVDDYIQDVRLKAWLYPHVYEGVVASSVAIDYQRKAIRRPQAELTEEMPPQGDFVATLARRLDSIKAFPRLTEAESHALTQFVQGASLQPTQRVNLRRARQRLERLCAS